MTYPAFDGSQLCAQTDPEVFFPERGSHDQSHLAKSICAKCPFKKPCAEYALYFDIRGIWGGTSEEDRRRIGKARGIKRTTVLPPIELVRGEISQDALNKRKQREREQQSQALGVA